MITQKFKTSILIFSIAFISMASCKKEAYNKVTTNTDSSTIITKATPGSLETSLTDAEKANTTKLVITGNIDARDFKVMHLDMPKLTVIDLSKTNIVSYSGTVIINYSGSGSVGEIDPMHRPFNANAIPYCAFIGKVHLTSIKLPNSIKAIGESSFLYCSGLKDVQIPLSDTIIGDDAFLGCSSLSSITKPTSVTKIGFAAFSDCISLSNFTIPSSVIWIGQSAFDNDSNLAIITINPSIIRIEYSAFYGCTGLKSIHVKNKTPFNIILVPNVSVFQNEITRSCTLYVPIGSKSTYQTTDGWKDFQNIVEE